ncbi:hypothetical protein F5Y09DRAFT_338060 [Xylaria sp. FL1042]|nr:hypothetical protein F5Y09DRAFT_338060 [Xylaria sp. FL1042]
MQRWQRVSNDGNAGFRDRSQTDDSQPKSKYLGLWVLVFVCLPGWPGRGVPALASIRSCDVIGAAPQRAATPATPLDRVPSTNHLLAIHHHVEIQTP